MTNPEFAPTSPSTPPEEDNSEEILLDPYDALKVELKNDDPNFARELLRLSDPGYISVGTETVFDARATLVNQELDAITAEISKGEISEAEYERRDVLQMRLEELKKAGYVPFSKSPAIEAVTASIILLSNYQSEMEKRQAEKQSKSIGTNDEQLVADGLVYDRTRVAETLELLYDYELPRLREIMKERALTAEEEAIFDIITFQHLKPEDRYKGGQGTPINKPEAELYEEKEAA